MKRQDIIEEIRLQNPWWSKKDLNLSKNIVERKIEDELKNELSKKKVTGIIGLRRVGKTTLLKLLIKYLLKTKEAKRICYFSFDLSEDITPRELIKIYSEDILKEPYPEYKKKVFFLFDEIQKVKNWGNHIKSIQDRELKIKFIVTGSSSMNITKGAGESLVGRIKIHRLNPFTFKEYLSYNGIKPEETSLEDINYVKNASTYRIHFNDYMSKGGMPELYADFSKGHLKEILDLVFFRDIVDIFTVKKTSVLKGIFQHITEKSGQKINYSNLADDLSTQYRTIKDYVQYLEDSFLIEKSLPFEKTHLKALRKNPKMYVSDHSYMQLWNTKEGLKAQTIAFNHVKQLGEIYFFNDPEVDILLPDKKMAFEIKYSNNITKEDTKNLVKLPDGYELYLITKDLYDEFKIDGRKISLIPLWLFVISI